MVNKKPVIFKVTGFYRAIIEGDRHDLHLSHNQMESHLSNLKLNERLSPAFSVYYLYTISSLRSLALICKSISVWKPVPFV